MKLVEIVDEFENVKSANKSEDMKHLFRIQSARVHQLQVFLTKIQNQFPDWWNIRGKAEFGSNAGTFVTVDGSSKNWKEYESSQFPQSQQWGMPTGVSKAETKRIRDAFTSKYNNMIQAKRDYELAGGTYRNILENVDEFQNVHSKNKSENVKHLYRVQKAKCHAIDLFIHQLARQFPDWWKAEGYAFWEDHPTKEWELGPNEHFGSSIIPYRLPKTYRTGTEKIRAMFRRKYEDMKKAKKAFEDAGGTYPNEGPPDLEMTYE